MAGEHSRLYQTNLAWFDQLLALNEGYINDSFVNMWKLADPSSPLRSFNKSIRRVATMKDCTLLPPKITLEVENNDYNHLRYHLAFESGSLTIEYGIEGEKTFDVAGWVFVFRVLINQAVVPRDSPEFQVISNRVVFPGEFSLSKLWLDSTSVNLSDRSLLKESYFGGIEWDREDPEIQDNFATFISHWIRYADKDGQTIIGVAVDPAVGPSDGATFPPTFLTKQTYGWQNPEIVPPPPAKTGDSKNMLLYLMMSSGHEPPTPILFPPNNGMWNDDSKRNYGTCALSNLLFWEGWLLPILQEFNRDTQFYTTTPEINFGDDDDTEISYFWSVGRNPDGDDYFQWRDTENGGQYGSDWGNNKNIDVSTYKDKWNLGIKATQQSNNYNSVVFKPGSQEIVVSGGGSPWSRMDADGVSTPPWPSYDALHITLDWTITLVLSSVSEGGLALNVAPPNNDTGKYHKVTHWVDDSINWPFLQSENDKYAGEVEAYLDNTFDFLLPNLVRRLQDTLDLQNQLFLPGAGTFFFKNPTFNSHGDLLAEIRFDGVQGNRAEALKKRDQLKKQRKETEVPEKPQPLRPLKLKLNFKDAPGFRQVAKPEGVAEGKK